MTGPAVPDAELAAWLDSAWEMMERGVHDRRRAAHTPSAATIGEDGRPRNRVVVLREACRKRRVLRFHTDRRSSKAAELLADPRIALLVYEATDSIQIRAEGRAVLHTADETADRAWAESRPASRTCYGISPGPGSPIDGAGAYAMPSDADAIEGGRENFVAVLVAVESLEVLTLHHAGHRRARFTWTPGGNVAGAWLAP